MTLTPRHSSSIIDRWTRYLWNIKYQRDRWFKARSRVRRLEDNRHGRRVHRQRVLFDVIATICALFTGWQRVIIRGKTANNYGSQTIEINRKKKKKLCTTVAKSCSDAMIILFQRGRMRLNYFISLGTPRGGGTISRSIEKSAVHRGGTSWPIGFLSIRAYCSANRLRNRTTARCTARKLWKHHLPRASLSLISGEKTKNKKKSTVVIRFVTHQFSAHCVPSNKIQPERFAVRRDFRAIHSVVQHLRRKNTHRFPSRPPVQLDGAAQHSVLRSRVRARNVVNDPDMNVNRGAQGLAVLLVLACAIVHTVSIQRMAAIASWLGFFSVFDPLRRSDVPLRSLNPIRDDAARVHDGGLRPAPKRQCLPPNETRALFLVMFPPQPPLVLVIFFRHCRCEISISRHRRTQIISLFSSHPRRKPYFRRTRCTTLCMCMGEGDVFS